MNSYLIPVEMYYYDLVIVNGKEEECIRYINRNFNLPLDILHQDINEKCNGVTIFTNFPLIICWVRESLHHFNSALFHEIEHAANHILRSVGIPHIDETDECYAYLKSFIQERLFEKLKKERQRKIRKSKA